MKSNATRGQVLPLWIVATITMLGLAFFALNYGNTLRWQVRAQDAADSAAQALVAIQTERFNMMEEAIYGNNVEEYRIRLLLQAILMAAKNTGPCASYTGTGNCDSVYKALIPDYQQAVNRYTTNAQLLNGITYNNTYANWKNDAQILLSHLKSNCNTPGAAINPTGGDCAFNVSLNYATFRTGLQGVAADAHGILVPGVGRSGPAGYVDSETQTLFAPIVVDVVSCAKVPPLVSGFGGMKFPTFTAVGRAAATAVQAEEDYFEPGSIFDPQRGSGTNTLFQPQEQDAYAYPSGTYDWYQVFFGGNAAIDDTVNNGFSEEVYENELSVRLGWWNAVPVPVSSLGSSDPTPDLTKEC